MLLYQQLLIQGCAQQGFILGQSAAFCRVGIESPTGQTDQFLLLQGVGGPGFRVDLLDQIAEYPVEKLLWRQVAGNALQKQVELLLAQGVLLCLLPPTGQLRGFAFQQQIVGEITTGTDIQNIAIERTDNQRNGKVQQHG